VLNENTFSPSAVSRAVLIKGTVEQIGLAYVAVHNIVQAEAQAMLTATGAEADDDTATAAGGGGGFSTGGARVQMTLLLTEEQAEAVRADTEEKFGATFDGYQFGTAEAVG
jgi:hypothetical protein